MCGPRVGLGGVDHDGELGIRLDHDRVAGSSQLRVEDHPAPVVSRVEPETAGQSGVVGEDGSDTDKDGVVFFAKLEPAPPRRLAGDPLRVAGSGRDSSVEGNRGLGADPGPVVLRPPQPTPVEDAATLGTHTLGDLDALGAEPFGASRSDRIGIARGHHHPADPGGDDGIDARRGSSVVGAGLQGDENGAAAGADPGLGKGVHFGVRASATGVEAFADDLAILIEHHCADHRVGGRSIATTAREFEGVPHPAIVQRIDNIVASRRRFPILREGFPVARCLGFPSVAFRVFDIR